MYIKGILTQRGMLLLQDGNTIVYSDGVSHKLWQSQGDMLHPILLQISGGTLGACSVVQMASMLHPEIFVTQLSVTCPL